MEWIFFENRRTLAGLHSVKFRKTLSLRGLVFVSCLLEFRTPYICCTGLVLFLNSLFAVLLAIMRPAPFWAHLNAAFVLFNRVPTLWVFTDLGTFDRVMLLCSTEDHCEGRSQWDRFLVPFALFPRRFLESVPFAGKQKQCLEYASVLARREHTQTDRNSPKTYFICCDLFMEGRACPFRCFSVLWG